MPDKKLRIPGSIYQHKIREIQALIIEIRDNPTQDTLEKLMNIDRIECEGNTEYESFYRYLQYCLDQLPQYVQTSEENEDDE